MRFRFAAVEVVFIGSNLGKNWWLTCFVFRYDASKRVSMLDGRLDSEAGRVKSCYADPARSREVAYRL